MNAKYWLPICATAMTLAGCGQRTDQPATAEAPAASTVPAPTEAMPPPPANAMAQLAPTQGQTASGSLTLTAEGDSVRLAGTLQGLPPSGEFGFHIHEKGDCSAPDASSAGAHFNPGNAQHGSPRGELHHAGDMFNARSDAQGSAQVDTIAKGVSLDDASPTGVRGKAIVLHAGPDDYASQPAGNSGARIACGVIN